MSDLHLLVHDKEDSVGVVVVESVGESSTINGAYIVDGSKFTIDCNSAIPIGHKVALKDMSVGDTVLKYGHDIGKVVKEIKKGDHVHVHNIKTKKW